MFRFPTLNVSLKWQFVILVVLTLIAILFHPPTRDLDLPVSDPSVQEALEIARNPNPPFELDPTCTPILDYEPARTKVVLLFHGYTNCPAQYSELTPLLTEAGYNVYAPLLPYHGSMDKLTNATNYLTPEILEQHLGESISVAQALGEEVTTLGVSGGGVLATLALESPAVTHAVSLAPFHLPAMLPGWSITPTTKLVPRLPNYNAFWNPEVALNNPGRPRYAYRRFSSHSLAAYQNLTLRLPHSTREDDARLTLILNPNDAAINNEYAENYPEKLTKLNLESKVIYIPAEWNLEHDVIDPNQSFARPDLVYPFILEQLEK